MSTTTIVIHKYNIMPLKATRIALFIIGAGLAFLSLSTYIQGSTLFQAAPTNFFWGVFLIITSVFGLSEKSPFSPKVKITDDHILLKSGFWSGSKKLNWGNISQIEFGSYKVIFHLRTGNYVFKYDADSNVSISIKKALRTAGEEKNIPVIGG